MALADAELGGMDEAADDIPEDGVEADEADGELDELHAAVLMARPTATTETARTR
jgi:hypothetical protein